VPEQIGAFFQAEREWEGMGIGHWNPPATPLTFEQVCHILEAGVKTATPVGTAAPYVRTYDYPVNGTVNTIKTYSIETGNKVATADLLFMTYSFVQEFEFAGRSQETWTMRPIWMGHKPAVLG